MLVGFLRIIGATTKTPTTISKTHLRGQAVLPPLRIAELDPVIVRYKAHSIWCPFFKQKNQNYKYKIRYEHGHLFTLRKNCNKTQQF